MDRKQEIPRSNRSVPRSAALGAFETRLGWVGLAVTDAGILATSFMHGSERSALESVKTFSSHRGLSTRPMRSEELSHWQATLGAYFEGEHVDPTSLPVDSRGWTPFQARVYQQVRRIPRGRVATYGEVARAVGRPGAARAVGRAVAQNPVAPVVPCHRVVAAGGGLGGYGAVGGLSLKRELLRMEGWVRPAESRPK